MALSDGPQPGVDCGGISHLMGAMSTLAPSRPKANSRAKVVGRYDIAADAKKRISLRGAKTKYFHVKAFSNVCYLLEPRVLVPPEALSARTLRMVEASATHLQKGLASAPVDLKAFR